VTPKAGAHGKSSGGTSGCAEGTPPRGWPECCSAIWPSGIFQVPDLITERAFIRRGATGEYPLFFSSAERPLYGAFHPANRARGNKPVLVICHAIGTEHMLTQRIEALGARAAANTGFAAFCYHARGHGDSAGDPRMLTFADLVDDACAAADLARELSAASRIIWVGLRLGCLIAAEAMRRRHDARALALWEPLHCGTDYFRSMMRATFFTDVARGRRPGGNVDSMLEQLERNGELPIVGGYVYRRLYRDAKEAELRRSLQKWGGDTLIAQVQRRPTLSPDNQRLYQEIQQRGGMVTAALIRQEPPWHMMPIVKPQWTSESLLDATKEWLHGLE
jgi:pimeloyl-ACP methyl ester carboxylesterase